jgi:branched-chain amino acid transport system ATP-binding protein
MLDAVNLDVAYGKKKVLFGIGIKVDENSITCVVGANGAGKTTIINTICGLLKPTSGKIIFRGKDITKKAPHERCELGISVVPEKRGILEGLTVEENLKIGFYTISDRKKFKVKLDYIFDIFPILIERRKQMGGTLSGGEQQMLAIARALMSDPRLLLMDEPSTGLSPIYFNEVFKTIEELHKHGMAILLVEQNARKALSISEECYLLDLGKIVFSGKSDILLQDQKLQNVYLKSN